MEYAQKEETKEPAHENRAGVERSFMIEVADLNEVARLKGQAERELSNLC